MQDPQVAGTIASLGYQLGPDMLPTIIDLLDGEQQQLVDRVSPLAVDLPYGSHPRQVLDLYCGAQAADSGLPVLVFVHGGGFLRGDKGGDRKWHNASVGRMAAEAGFLGVVINYRLAPEHTWPSGGEDVALAVDWLRSKVADYGGDPERIVLVGTSAGAVHCATYLQLHPATRDVRGMVLLSGLYGFTPLDERDCQYYGPQSEYAQRQPKAAVVETELPLLVACAQFDPPRFQREFVGLQQARLDTHGAMPRSLILSGHNHYSMASHLGTSDTRLADEIQSFVAQSTQTA